MWFVGALLSKKQEAKQASKASKATRKEEGGRRTKTITKNMLPGCAGWGAHRKEAGRRRKEDNSKKPNAATRLVRTGVG